MSKLKGRRLFASAVKNAAIGCIFYAGSRIEDHLYPASAVPWGSLLAFLAAVCAVYSAGQVLGFLGWNFGMLMHRNEQRRFERLEAQIEAEVDRRIEREKLREAKKSLRELTEVVRDRNKWMQAAAPTMAMRLPEHQDWHDRSFGDEGGWRVWPCDCNACGGTSRATLHGGPVIRCGIEFVLKQDGRHAYASLTPNQALRITDGVSLAPWVLHRIDLGPVPDGILIPENVTEAEAEQFKRDLHASLERS